jgi:hypothetical protein
MSVVRTERFDTPETITLRLSCPVGLVRVIAEPSTVTTVEFSGDEPAASEIAAKARVELTGRELVVHLPDRAFRMFRRCRGFAVTVRLPENSAVVGEVAAATLATEGILSRAGVNTASGEVRIGDVTGDVRVKSASGAVSAGHVAGRADIRSASGAIRIAAVGADVEAHSASGSVTMGSLGGSATIRTASGAIHVGSLERGTAELKSASGAISVGIAAGTGVWLDVSSLSGTTSTDLPVGGEEPAGGHQLRLVARSLSGSVQVTRAASSPIRAS